MPRASNRVLGEILERKPDLDIRSSREKSKSQESKPEQTQKQNETDE